MQPDAEAIAERIAIMVIDGGLDPAEAERQARRCIEARTDVETHCNASLPKQMEFEGQGYKVMLSEFYRKCR